MLINSTIAKMLEKKNLSFEEAEGAMLEIMSGNAGHIKLAAWLTAMRSKGETPDEISGCATAMRENAIPIKCNDSHAVDTCGTGGDGAGTFNISTAAAFVAAACEITVAKHGNRSISSKSGSADVLSALGVKIELSPEKMQFCLNEIGGSFLFAPLLHPAMKHAMPVRKELGFRTIFNVLGPLSNPAGTKRAVIGVYSMPLCKTIAEAMLKLGAKRAFVVHGYDGIDEITTCAETKICEIRDGHIKEFNFNPLEYGIQKSPPDSLKGGSPDENAELMRKILKGKETGAIKDAVILNSAAAILASDKTNTWNDAIKMALNALETGKAFIKLEQLVKATNS